MKSKYIGLFIVGLMLASCSGSNDSASDTTFSTEFPEGSTVITHEQFEASGMNLVQFQEVDAREQIEVTGQVRVFPDAFSMVSNVTGGRVTEIMTSPGVRVDKGDPLFELEDPSIIEVQQEYANACAQLPVLESDFERQRNLLDDDVASRKVFEQAKAAYLSGKARCSGLEKQLQLLGIDAGKVESTNFVSSVIVRAPVSGYVTLMELKKGGYLEPNEEVLEIIDPSSIYLALKVYEKDLTGIREGLDVNFRPAGNDSSFHRARISKVVPKVQGDSRSVSVHAEIEESPEGLWPGMFVDAVIMNKSGKMIALPDESVVEIEGRKWALIQKAQTDEAYAFEQVEVQTKPLENGMTAILNHQDFSADASFLGEGAFGLINN